MSKPVIARNKEQYKGRYSIEYSTRVFRDEAEYQNLRKRAFYSVRKHIEGKGITFIPADAEIAVDQAVTELWERKGYIDYKRLKLFENGSTVPVIAFIAQRARSRYYDTFRKGHAQGLALTEVHGKAKHDQRFDDIEFWDAIKTLDSQQVRQIIADIVNGYSVTETAESMGTSKWNIYKTIDRKVKPAVVALDSHNMSRLRVRKPLRRLNPIVQWYLSGYREHAFLFQNQTQWAERFQPILPNAHRTHVRTNR